MEVRTDRETLEALLNCGILKIANSADEIVSLEEAEQDLHEVMVYAMDGKAFSLRIEYGIYILTPEGWSL